MENDLASFNPNKALGMSGGMSKAKLEQFYNDISDDDDDSAGEVGGGGGMATTGDDAGELKCPMLHNLEKANPGDFQCDVCLRKKEVKTTILTSHVSLCVVSCSLVLSCVCCLLSCVWCLVSCVISYVCNIVCMCCDYDPYVCMYACDVCHVYIVSFYVDRGCSMLIVGGRMR